VSSGLIGCGAWLCSGVGTSSQPSLPGIGCANAAPVTSKIAAKNSDFIITGF
jgi:hypothetical protein